MSKELTEQWRNGTLPYGFYYLKTKDGRIRADDTVYIVGEKQYRWRYTDVVFIEEVLAPVPTCEEWKAAYECQLMESEEVLTLKQQLKEAEKVIKFYANADQLTDEEKQMTNDYLYKYGVR